MQINRWKLFYLSLCVFFILGSYATACANGEQAQAYPDMSWSTPEWWVGYYNNYINEKVNLSTMGDILVTEYLEHPQELGHTFQLVHKWCLFYSME